METLKSQVEQILIEQFPDAEIELEELPLSDKLSGHVVSETFSALTTIERTHLLRNVLRSRLNAAQQQMLSIIIPLSPAEHNAMVAYG